MGGHKDSTAKELAESVFVLKLDKVLFLCYVFCHLSQFLFKNHVIGGTQPCLSAPEP